VRRNNCPFPFLIANLSPCTLFSLYRNAYQNLLKHKVSYVGMPQRMQPDGSSQLGREKGGVSVKLVLASHHSPIQCTSRSQRVHKHQEHRRCAKVQNHGTLYLAKEICTSLFERNLKKNCVWVLRLSYDSWRTKAAFVASGKTVYGSNLKPYIIFLQQVVCSSASTVNQKYEVHFHDSPNALILCCFAASVKRWHCE